MNKLEEKSAHSAEQVLAELGAKIDDLIEAAIKAKALLSKKEEMAVIHGQFALKELREGLEAAWSELSQAWKEHSLTTQAKEESPAVTIVEDDFPGTA